MKLAHFSLAWVLALAVSPAVAQVVDGGDIDEVVAAAQAIGDAQLEAQPDGAPRLSGKANGIAYHVFFLNCSSGECEDLNFYAGFADVKPTMDAMNAWNRENRFGRAYLDSDLDAVLEYDINLQYGVSSDNLGAAFAIWSLLLDEFGNYVGYTPATD